MHIIIIIYAVYDFVLADSSCPLKSLALFDNSWQL